MMEIICALRQKSSTEIIIMMYNRVSKALFGVKGIACIHRSDRMSYICMIPRQMKQMAA